MNTQMVEHVLSGLGHKCSPIQKGEDQSFTDPESAQPLGPTRNGARTLQIALGVCSPGQTNGTVSTRSALETLGCQCHEVAGPDELRDLLKSRHLDGAVLDVDFGRRSIRNWLGDSPVGTLTLDRVVCRVDNGESTIEDLLRLAKVGVRDIILNGADGGKLKEFVNHLHGQYGTSDIAGLSNVPAYLSLGKTETLGANDLDQLIVGSSEAMQSVRETIVEVAATKATVLVYGEPGTGKELAAYAIHLLSMAAQGPFVPVDMASIPSEFVESLLFGQEQNSSAGAEEQIGYCELANGGTLFLDEVSEMGLQAQPNLLRFLQAGVIHPVGSQHVRVVDARIIGATNTHPATLVERGKLREDLYFRLNVIPIHVPPLRERVEDIEQLAQLFLNRFAVRHDRSVGGFTSEALECLRRYSWPGNVRQLENVVERMVVFAKEPLIRLRAIPQELMESPRNIGATTQGNGDAIQAVDSAELSMLLKPIQQKERAAIVESLQQTDGHVVEAAQLLGLSQATMYRKIKEYHIVRERRRRKPQPRQTHSPSQ